MQKVAVFLLFLQPILGFNKKFPDDFLFGVASSAYQIEGGHDANGKGENIWDYHLRLNPDLVEDSTNGNIACDSYNNYQDDLALVGDLGVDFYRFSISWSRLLPKGLSNLINPDGLRYYNAMIDGLLAKNIQPMITLYHWDLPKPLQDLGGWTNPLMADYFEDYARTVFEKFGDRVKLWITFNTNWFGYDDEPWPPMLNQSGIGEYLYVKNIVLAHAKAYRLYDKQFRDEQMGHVGFTVDAKWYEAASDSVQDREAAERVRQFLIGTMINPIFGNGDFPGVVKNRVDELSRKEGFVRSRLPKFSHEERDLVKGAYDFLGLNIYTAFLIKDVEVQEEGQPSFSKDLKADFAQDPNWARTKAFWLTIVPEAFRNSLSWIKSTYGNLPIYITENGCPYDEDGELEDLGRINYLKLHLHGLLEAIHEDGVQVKGYTVWSLLDNFEWTNGYSLRFGLNHVHFTDPKRKRTPKSSAKWYKDMIKRRELEETTPKTEL